MDKITVEKRSWNMSRIKGKDTKPELIVRRRLFAEGYRYRVQYKLRGKPDIAFPSIKLAVFIHGCFWHRHGCKNSNLPKSNSTFWENKLKGNVERDIRNREFLMHEGWVVLTIWECEIEDKNLLEVKIDELEKLIPKLKA